MHRRRTYSTPDSAARLAELEAAIAELQRRQAAQPKGESGFLRRARLALLVAAFERRRDLVAAGLRRESGDRLVIDAGSEPVKSER